MRALLKGAFVCRSGGFVKADLYVDGHRVYVASGSCAAEHDVVFDLTNKYICPGFTDVHVHFREPGFSYKETIRTGSLAAAKGGYTTVFTMPNLEPCQDDLPHLKSQLDIIRDSAAVNVIPYGSITRGEKGRELSDMEAMAPYVCAFSDDGHGLQDENIMLKAMLRAKSLNKIIAAHCEVNSLTSGGVVNDCDFARAHGLPVISGRSEWQEIERDLDLAAETGCKLHICHISTAKSAELIRQAKRDGVDVSCETAPHYLALSDRDLRDEGRFRMNPPLRSENDRQALLGALRDGTIDMIATDHAPHSAAEKDGSFASSLFGITGLETAFPVLYTTLVKGGVITAARLIDLLSVSPRRRFGLPPADLFDGPADLTVFDGEAQQVTDSSSFLSGGHSTPFDGLRYTGEILMTFVNGEIVWQKK